jgi:hypothetical protein
MINMAQINRDAWELAAIAMIKNGGKVEAYSTSQIRKIMSALKSLEYQVNVKNIIDNYSPAPPQGKHPNQAQGEIRTKRETNDKFGNKLLEIIQDHDDTSTYAQKLFKYALWNIKIIEQNFKGRVNKLPLIFECENLDNRDNILVMLKNISSSAQAPRKNYGHDNRNQIDGNYRRRG